VTAELYVVNRTAALWHNNPLRNAWFASDMDMKQATPPA